jgi:hypothetical protein
LLAISRRRYDDAATAGAGITVEIGGEADGALPVWAKTPVGTAVNDKANATTEKKRNMSSISSKNKYAKGVHYRESLCLAGDQYFS